MSDDSSDNMILRTLYLPRELDQELRAAAFRSERSKGDLIRELIEAGLATRKAAGAPGVSPRKATTPVTVVAAPRVAMKASTAKKAAAKVLTGSNSGAVKAAKGAKSASKPAKTHTRAAAR